ncbi:MAG: WYL domain-containing protein [Actinobacteria bacterium]|nr:WYL domain-containing protein [Actinomycetota bacterium]
MTRRGPRPVNLRLRRLLVMLPWLAERGTVSTAAMAEHFAMTVPDLMADLTLASLCGVSQDPRDLIDLWVDEEAVHFGIPKYFNRPLRLTAPEAFSLVASATAARNLTGSDLGGALNRAVDKVARALGIDDVDRLVVELETPAAVADFARAAEAGVEVTISHWSVTTGDSVERRIVPAEVFMESDHWYVRALDLGVGAERTFRLDRIESHQVGQTRHDVDLGPRRPWFSDPVETTRVTIEMDPAWMWVLEQYPGVTIDEVTTPRPQGWVSVSMPVSSERWLQRLLLRLGSHARVRAPESWTDLASDTARLVLTRYGKK